MNLRNSRLADMHDRSDFFHGEFLEVVEAEYFSIAARQPRDRRFEQSCHLRSKRLFIGVLFRRFDAPLNSLFSVRARSRLQARNLQTTKLGDKLLEVLEAELHFRGDFDLIGLVAKFRLATQGRLLQAAALPSQSLRTPVQEPQAVQNGAPDTDLGIVLELHVLARIKFARSIDQTENPRVDQIFAKHVRWQTTVDAPGDVLNLRKIFEQENVALGRIKIRGLHDTQG